MNNRAIIKFGRVVIIIAIIGTCVEHSLTDNLTVAYHCDVYSIFKLFNTLAGTSFETLNRHFKIFEKILFLKKCLFSCIRSGYCMSLWPFLWLSKNPSVRPSVCLSVCFGFWQTSKETCHPYLSIKDAKFHESENEFLTFRNSTFEAAQKRLEMTCLLFLYF